MAWQLLFDELHQYDAGEPGITLPVFLRLGSEQVTVTAKLDTGASHCIFERIYADALGVDLESGQRLRVGTAVGSFVTYGHTVTLTVKEYDFEVVAYFAEDYAINRNVLGSNGFLNRLRLGLLDYEGKLLLSRQEDALSL
jgi:hypothetical protein